MTNFILTSIAAAALTIGAGATAVAASPDNATTERPDRAKGAKKGKRKGGKIGRFCAKAECTPDQKQELTQITKEFRQDIKPEREKMREVRKQLTSEYKKDSPNEAAMKRAYTQLDALQDNVRDRRHDMMMEVHGVLSPEQRELAMKMLAKKGKHGKKGKPGKKGKKGSKRAQ